MEWQPYWEFMQRLSQMPPAILEENAGAADACTAAVQPAKRGYRGLDQAKSRIGQGWSGLLVSLPHRCAR
jgi:hypothetical protein